MHIPEEKSFELLKAGGVLVSGFEDPEAKDYFLTVTFDRSLYKPCVMTSYSIGGESAHNHAKTYPLTVKKDGSIDTWKLDEIVQNTLSDFRVKSGTAPSEAAFDTLYLTIRALIDVFSKKEASSLTTRVFQNQEGKFEVARATFEFDDAAQKSGRQTDIKDMRDTSTEVPAETEAEKDGIVYVK